MADTATTHTNSHGTASAGLLSLYADLVKLRLSLLVVLTAGVGCIMASGPMIDWLLVLWTVSS